MAKAKTKVHEIPAKQAGGLTRDAGAFVAGIAFRDLPAEAVRIAPLVHVTLSVDHRLINGAAAARFLARVKQIVENGELA